MDGILQQQYRTSVLPKGELADGRFIRTIAAFLRAHVRWLPGGISAEGRCDLFPDPGGSVCEPSYVFSDLSVGPSFCERRSAGGHDGHSGADHRDLGQRISACIRKAVPAPQDDPDLWGPSRVRTAE